MQDSTVQIMLTQVIAKHDAAKAKADQLMSCQSDNSLVDVHNLSYWRGQQHAFNEAACVLKGALDFEAYRNR